ncbi:hypothetical protein N1851_028937 [Merluccius polli]|uniref:CCHC-type domain-containing protein n=1 Tax=Merluccius polli TaxID=89951 RepID=A0AA47NS48_MERPO|nr:hypothetical protein N1851_028937 [Merluccius polli]
MEGKEKLMEGVRVKGVMVHARDIVNNEVVVSFINLPVYLTDGEILAKLEQWGVRAMSAIKRRMWPGTEIADGTRYLKVRLNDQVSLRLRGVEYFRVIHDRQVRVCRLCIKPGHIFRECPEFKCFRCHQTGHYARECEERRGGADGGVERGVGKKNVMGSRVEREEETLRHGGRYGGAARRKEEDGEKGKIQEVRSDNISKELVINVEIEGEDIITMIDLLKAVELTCGRVLGCRTKNGKRWELTMSNAKGKERLLDGFKIKNSRIVATELIKNIRVVSFLNLPLYITDDQIKYKLSQWGVEPASNIRRRKWAGTEIFDGARFLKVKFPEAVSSLPYSTKFDTLEGSEYFRVLHDQQEKVCRLCLQPGHILRECPEFYCFRCKKQGHYARECADMTAVAMEKGEMAEEEEEDVEEEGSGKEEALSGMETDEEERRESEEELEAVGGKESSSDSANATRGTQMLKGRSEVTEQRGGVESEDSGSRRGRSRSVLRSSDGGGNSLSEGQLSTSKGVRPEDVIKGEGKNITEEESEALPQRGTRGRKNKKDKKK